MYTHSYAYANFGAIFIFLFEDTVKAVKADVQYTACVSTCISYYECFGACTFVCIYTVTMCVGGFVERDWETYCNVQV